MYVCVCDISESFQNHVSLPPHSSMLVRVSMNTIACEWKNVSVNV